ncbi:MAG: hypothetical protein PCFJNLEI_01393 [Verrucomicrobiae bacterium]|nr:hypothetical protein [Verrucomicrobiae bacterium]
MKFVLPLVLEAAQILTNGVLPANSPNVRLESFPALTTTAIVRQAQNGSVDVQDLPTGLYRVNGESFVCLARPSTRGAVSLFTHHNRRDYRQGETIEVTAVCRAHTATHKADLVLTDGGGARVSLGQLTFAGTNDSRFISIPAAQLQPGRYLLGTEAADLIGHRIVLEIFPEELRTTWEGFASRICETGPFRTAAGLCNYRLLQNSPVETLTGAEVEQYTGQDALPAELAEVCRRELLFPVPEAVARYDENERNLAAATRFGVQFLPRAVWGMDTQSADWNPLHTYPEGLDWMRRMYALRAQMFREFASFGGFFVNWYPSLRAHYEAHPQRAGFAEPANTLLRAAVSEAQGPLPAGWAWSKEDGFHLTNSVKEADILATGLTHPLFNSPAHRELVEWKVRGQRRRTGAFTEAYAAWTEVPRQLGDWDYVSFVPVGWFRGPDYYPPIYFSTLPRAGIHAYTDWQADPFMELFGIDYYGAGSGKPAWVQGMSGARNMQIRQTFLAAGRGAWGVGFDVRKLVPTGREGEDIRLVCDLMNRYGPYFMGLRPQSRVAIVRSLRQETADAGKYRDAGGRNGMIWFDGLQGELWALYYNLLRAGCPAAFVTEDEIAAGALEKYEAVFLHRQRLLMSPELMQRFATYVAKGGKVFKDPLSAPEFPGETVDLSPDPAVTPHAGVSDHVIGTRYVWMLENFLRCKARVETVLSKLPPPPVRTDNHHIVHTALTGKDTTALLVINDTLVPARVQEAEKKWFIQGAFTMTRQGQLTFDKPCFIYDVTEGGRETKVTGAYPVDFRRSEGHILLRTERPVRDVKLELTLTADVLRIAPRVLDDAGQPFADALPFELVLRDPAGRETKRVYRAAGPNQSVELAMGRNLAAGRWTVTAQELVTGREARADLPVAARPPITVATGKVLARRSAEIRRFLQEKNSFTIVLDEGQPDSYAEPVAAALRRAGKTCEVRRLDPRAIADLPLRWRRSAEDEALWQRVTRGEVFATRRGLTTRGDGDYENPESGYEQPGPRFAVFRDVILIGSPADNRLIADLHGIVGQPATEFCPGPGGALIQLVRDGFAPRYDALTMQVADAAGVTAGTAWLAQPAEPPAKSDTTTVTAASTGSATRQPLPDYQQDGFGTPIAGVVPVDAGERLLVSLAGTQISGCGLFQVNTATGAIVERYPDVLGSVTPLGPGRFVQRWRDRLVFRGSDLKPLWQLRGKAAETLVAHGDNLYVSGEGRVLRLDGNGQTIWVRDFSGEIRDERDFLKPCRATVQAVSPDGKRVLVATYRERMYGAQVHSYEVPALRLLDAATGEVLWQYRGVLVRDTACGFFGDRILACDAGAAPRLVVLDMTGQVVRSNALPAKITRAQPVGERQALLDGTLLDLDTGALLPVPVTGAIKGAWAVGETVVAGTWDKELVGLDANLQPRFWTRLPSLPAVVLANPTGAGLIVGTDSGQVLWLNATGAVVRATDFNPFNLAESDEQWARRWLAESLASVPEKQLEPWVGKPASTLERAAKVAEVLAKTEDFTCEADATYVLSLFAKAASVSPTGITVRVEFGEGTKPFEVSLPTSVGWEERTVAFRPPAGSTRGRLVVKPEPGVTVERTALAQVRFRSGNLLSGDEIKVSQVIPWVAHIAKASGLSQTPPRIVTPAAMLTDGQLANQETSWTGKPLPQGIFSDHAELVMTFKSRRKLSAVAVYQDPATPERYTKKFAVFAKTKAGVKLLGAVTNNQSPYTLFTFDPVEADSLIYYWAGSGDGHVRLAEIEAYGLEDHL